jgi:hypothetical protein
MEQGIFAPRLGHSVVCGEIDAKSDVVSTFPESQVHTAIVEKFALFVELKRQHSRFSYHISEVCKSKALLQVRKKSIVLRNYTFSVWGILIVDRLT